SADCLGERNPRSQGVGECGQRDAPAATADPGTHRTQGDGTPDSQTAFPDLDCVDGVASLAEVQLVRGDDVVQPPADKTEGHRPHGDVRDRALLPATGDPAPVAEPDGDE